MTNETEVFYNPKTAFGNPNLIKQLEEERERLERMEAAKDCNRCDEWGKRQITCSECSGFGEIDVICEHTEDQDL